LSGEKSLKIWEPGITRSGKGKKLGEPGKIIFIFGTWDRGSLLRRLVIKESDGGFGGFSSRGGIGPETSLPMRIVHGSQKAT
jgi:hypothetical protein